MNGDLGTRVQPDSRQLVPYPHRSLGPVSRLGWWMAMRPAPARSA